MSDNSSVKFWDYAIKLEEWFVEFSMLSRRFSDGIACQSYGNLVGRGKRSLENKWDVVEFVMSCRRWSNDFSC